MGRGTWPGGCHLTSKGLEVGIFMCVCVCVLETMTSLLRHRFAQRNPGKYSGQMEGSVSDPTLAVDQKKKKSVNKYIKRKYKQGSKIILENHQAKFFWNDSRRGEKSKHFDNVNNLAIQTSCHSCSLNKNITTSKRLWQESMGGRGGTWEVPNTEMWSQPGKDGSFLKRPVKCSVSRLGDGRIERMSRPGFVKFPVTSLYPLWSFIFPLPAPSQGYTP